MTNYLRVATTAFSLKNYASDADLCVEFERCIRFAKDYRASVILFPEYSIATRAGLVVSLDTFNKWRTLAGSLALKYKIWILGLGAAVELDSNKRNNISIIASPDGSTVLQSKLHLTEYEITELKLQSESTINVFSIESIQCAMLVCLDVEFPEPCRQLANSGCKVLFVPSWTDDHYGKNRVRICAQSRCIENQIFTVLSTLTGNSTHLGLEQGVGEAGVFAPADLGFPPDGVLARSGSALEVVVAELDLNRLDAIRQNGTVIPHKQIKTDQYKIVY